MMTTILKGIPKSAFAGVMERLLDCTILRIETNGDYFDRIKCFQIFCAFQRQSHYFSDAMCSLSPKISVELTLYFSHAFQNISRTPNYLKNFFQINVSLKVYQIFFKFFLISSSNTHIVLLISFIFPLRFISA